MRNGFVRMGMVCGVAAAGLAVLGSAGISGARQVPDHPSAPPVLVYELGDQSAYTQGCVGMCLCALWFGDNVTGSFGLTQAGVDDHGTSFFDVINFSAKIGSDFPEDSIDIVGGGIYAVNAERGFHRMDLYISIGGTDPFRITSGWDKIDPNADGIEITLDNKPTCYGVFLTINTDQP